MPAYLGRVAAVATADRVDEAGLLWLRRPAGWRERLDALTGGVAADESALRREQRRRTAAEEALHQARDEHERDRGRWARERELRAELQERLADVEGELKSERDRRVEVEAKLAAAHAALDQARRAGRHDRAAAESAAARVAEAEAARDAVLAARAGEPLPLEHAMSPGLEVTAVRWAHDRAAEALAGAQAALAEAARRLAEAARAAPARPPVAEVNPRSSGRRRDRPRRAPLQIPGGLLASSVAVTEHLLRATGAVVLIDGYNVAKLGWPSLELAVQRELLVAAAEDVAKRWGVDITVVFDGATVTGASTPVRRLVRVTFSPAGVSADDVLRAEVAGLDPQRPVVVVTSDQQVVTDVRADGANTIASDQFLAVARR